MSWVLSNEFDVNGVHSYTEHCTSLLGLGKHNSPIFVYGPDNKIPGTLFLHKPHHGFFIISVDFVQIILHLSCANILGWVVHLLARISLLWSFWVVIAESSNNWRQTVSCYCIGSVMMKELHWSTRRVHSGHEEASGTIFHTSLILLHAWTLDGNINMLSRMEGKEGIKENRPSERSDRQLGKLGS